MGDVGRQDAQAAGKLGVHVGQRLGVGLAAIGAFGQAHVPQPAAVGADLVGHDQAHEVAFPDPADLDLKVGQADAHAHHHAG